MNAPERAQFLANRQLGIGGSDIAAVMGLSPWKTPVQLWLEKTGQAANDEESERLYWGTVLEDVVAREYAKRTGNRIERVRNQIIHPKYSWARANLDRIVWQGSKRPVVGSEIRSKHLLECKTGDAFTLAEWEETPDSAPIQYLAQVMWYMGVTGGDMADIAVLIGGNRYLQRRIERDDEVIRVMFEKANEFWNGYVIPRVAPPATCGADAALLFKVDNGASLAADLELTDLVDRARAADEKAKTALEAAESLKDELKVRMQAAAAIVAPSGELLCTWKASKPRETLDTTALREEMPDIADRFTRAGDPVRTFLFK